MWGRIVAAVRQRGELVGLAGLLMATLVLPGDRPTLGVYVAGLAAGGAIALQAIGLVLVFRANRVINFAQAQLGGVAGILLAELATRRQFLVFLHEVCPTCVPAPAGRVALRGIDVTEISRAQLAALVADGWLVTANYVIAAVAALGAAALVSYGSYHLVVKRFSEAPRVVLTVVTIALAAALEGVRGGVPLLLGEGPEAGRATLPFDVRVTIGRTVLESHELVRVAIAAVAVVALAVVLRRTAGGVALRGVADDASRAETLGVPVTRLTARVWVVAGLISGAVSMLDAAAVGVSEAASPAALLRSLAAAVFAGLTSLPIAVFAAAVIGVFDQSILWSLDSSLITDGVLLVVVVAVLLVLHQRRARADTDESAWTAAREIRPTPAVLRGVDSVARAKRSVAIAIGVVALGLPWVLSPSQNVEAIGAVLTGIIALSLFVLTGWAGQISLGQFGFAATGAWVAAVLGWPLPFALLAGGLAGAAVAVVLGISALRLKGMYLSVTTLAFAVAVPAVLLNPQYLARELPPRLDRPVLLGLDLDDERTFYYVGLALLVVATVAVVGLRRSRTARALVACRDNEAAAQSFGINLVQARLTAFAFSGFLAAFAGVLLAYAQSGVASATFSPTASINVFLVAMLGGLGSVAGPLLGVGYMTALALLSFSPIVGQLTTSIGVLAVVIMLPGGLLQAVVQIRDAFLRRVADRRHLVVPSLLADMRADDVDHRAPILPKRKGGTTVFVPRRYKLDRNWAIPSPVDEAERESSDQVSVGG